MLDKGVHDGIIIDYKDIFRHFVEDSVVSATEAPYFESDFWSSVLEEFIEEVEQLKLRKEERLAGEDSGENNSETGERKTDVVSGSGANADTLAQKIFSTMSKHRAVSDVELLWSSGKTGSAHVRGDVLGDRLQCILHVKSVPCISLRMLFIAFALIFGRIFVDCWSKGASDVKLVLLTSRLFGVTRENPYAISGSDMLA